MLQGLKTVARRLVPRSARDRIRARVTKPVLLHAEDGAFLKDAARYTPSQSEGLADFARIEARAAATEQSGAHPLWEGYERLVDYPTGEKRSSEQVRSSQTNGRFFCWTVSRRRPETVVEFGTAFGVSGMYWLSGLERNGHGTLYTFEPNETWAGLARLNLESVGSRFVATAGTFEENLQVIDDASASIDFCFIDAIHTGDFVRQQLDLVLPRARSGSLIFFDDIFFSADMTASWK